MPAGITLYRPGQALEGAPRINWAHPLARNLLWFLAPSGGVLRDVVRGWSGTLFGAASWAGATRMGAALYSPGNTTDGGSFPQPDNHVFGNLGVTHTLLSWTYIRQFQGTNINTLIAIPYWNNSSNSPFFAVSLQFWPNDSPNPQYGLNYFYSSSTSGWTKASDGYNHFADTGLHCWAAVRSGANVTFYRDGVQTGSGTLSANVTPLANTPGNHIVLLNQDDVATGQQAIGSVASAAIWGRALTQAELVQIARDPYVMLTSRGDPVRDPWLSAAHVPSTWFFTSNTSAVATTNGKLNGIFQFTDVSTQAVATTVGAFTRSVVFSDTTASAVATTAGTFGHLLKFSDVTASATALTTNLLKIISFLIPHPLGLYVAGYDRAGDGVGGRQGHGANSLTLTYTVLPPGAASLSLSYHVEPLGGAGLLLTYYVQSPYSQFAINGNTAVPAPQHLVYNFAPVIGYDMDALSIKQGYTSLQWQYDLLFDDQIAVLMSLYDPQNPQVTIVYLNEMGFWSQKQVMMQPPNLGTRTGITHQNVSITFTHIIPD